MSSRKGCKVYWPSLYIYMYLAQKWKKHRGVEYLEQSLAVKDNPSKEDYVFPRKLPIGALQISSKIFFKRYSSPTY